MTATQPLMEVRQLSVQHSVRAGARGQTGLEAVRQLSLSVAEGEIVALVGESGCGKSSLARAMVGLLAPSSGEIYFRGVPLQGLNGEARKNWRMQTQMIFQDPHAALSPRRTIAETLAEALELQDAARAQQQEQHILNALFEVNLSSDILQRYPHQLSGGQKQRIALARALLCQPSLIIADEPLSALDVSEQARLLRLFSKLRTDKQIAFILIAHDLAAVQQVADRVAVMYLGQLLELAPAARFFRAAAHPYSQALLQATQRNWRSGSSVVPGLAVEPVLSGEPPSALTPPSGCVFHTRCAQRLEHCSRVAPEQQTLVQQDTTAVAHQVLCHLYSTDRKSPHLMQQEKS